jgi:hypothetical protein
MNKFCGGGEELCPSLWSTSCIASGFAECQSCGPWSVELVLTTKGQMSLRPYHFVQMFCCEDIAPQLEGQF